MESLDTRVGSSIYVSGRIEGEGNVLVQGRVDGSISIKGDLHIDPAGQIKSSVQARNIYVMGILVGDAIASEKIELAPGGRMVGNVKAPRFLINEDAAYRGKVDMVGFEAEDRPMEKSRTNRQSTSRASTPVRRSSSPAAIHRASHSEVRRETVAAAQRTQPAQASSGAGQSSSTPPANLYTPPPLPRPPEFLGARKAIVIKKKRSDSG